MNKTKLTFCVASDEIFGETAEIGTYRMTNIDEPVCEYYDIEYLDNISEPHYHLDILDVEQ